MFEVADPHATAEVRVDEEPKDRVVYSLSYPVATTRWPAGTPFYVGKGRERRPEDHLKGAKIYLSDEDFERQVISEKNPFKLRVIRQILKSGHVPVVEYTHRGLTVKEANEIEVEEIARIGRFDLRLGPLTNLTNGGEGTRGYRPPEHLREQARQREADPERKELSRIQQRALQRFPEIKEKQRTNLALARARPEVQEKHVLAREKKKARYQASRDLVTPRVIELYERGFTLEEIRQQLALCEGVVCLILKTNPHDKIKHRATWLARPEVQEQQRLLQQRRYGRYQVFRDSIACKVINLYEEGLNPAEIQRKLSLPQGVVPRVLKDNPHEIEKHRSNRDATCVKPYRSTSNESSHLQRALDARMMRDWIASIVIRHYEAGDSMEEIAALLSVPRGRVVLVLQENDHDKVKHHTNLLGRKHERN